MTNNLDVADIKHTYSPKAANARNTKHLKKIIRNLKEESDLRKVKMEETD